MPHDGTRLEGSTSVVDRSAHHQCVGSVSANRESGHAAFVQTAITAMRNPSAASEDPSIPTTGLSGGARVPEVDGVLLTISRRPRRRLQQAGEVIPPRRHDEDAGVVRRP